MDVSLKREYISLDEGFPLTNQQSIVIKFEFTEGVYYLPYLSVCTTTGKVKAIPEEATDEAAADRSD